MDDAGGLEVGDEVWVERVKYPDIPHYGNHGVYLGEDEHGRWVGSPGDRKVYRGSDVLFVADDPAIQCVPRDDWYLMIWFPATDARPDRLYIDIATPTTWHGHRASAIDLDFDIWVEGDRVELLDVDEFEHHQVVYGYPDALVADARRACTKVWDWVRAGRPPMQPDVPRRWYEQWARTDG
jgi:uncharacterized protein